VLNYKAAAILLGKMRKILSLVNGEYIKHHVFTARQTLGAVLRSHVVCLSVCLSVTLVDCDHIGWNSSIIISRLVIVGRSLSADPNIMDYTKGSNRKFGPKVTHLLLIWASETFDHKLRPNGYR